MKILVKLRNMRPEECLYRLVLLGIVIFFVLLVNLRLFYPNFSIPSCYIKKLFGLYCPGCGGTRALYYLCKGQFLKSIYYHPFVPYFSIILTWFMVRQTASYLTRRKIKGPRFKLGYILVGAVIIVMQWILKNIFLIYFGFYAL